MTAQAFRGVLVPVLTPFKADLSPDAEALANHCRWLLEQGADGLAVFGTTSEANSLGVDERTEMLDTLIDRGVPPSMLMPGTGTCAITDTVRLTAHAVNRGCAGVLMLPPFYYKAVNDDGLFESFAEVIQRVGDAALRVYLYHIPPVANVPISLSLIGRLLDAYDDIVVGIKDSSGEWSNTQAILKEYPALATFCGSEVFLLDTLRNGGAGSITATANVNPAGIRMVFERWRSEEADELQARVTSIRQTIEKYPTIPALKAITAEFYDEPDWKLARPPLRALETPAVVRMISELTAIDFQMGGSG